MQAQKFTDSNFHYTSTTHPPQDIADALGTALTKSSLSSLECPVSLCRLVLSFASRSDNNNNFDLIKNSCPFRATKETKRKTEREREMAIGKIENNEKGGEPKLAGSCSK